MEPLKNLYNQTFVNQLAAGLIHAGLNIDHQQFNQQYFYSEWDKLELKERTLHTTKLLHTYLPEKFEDAVEILQKLVTYYQKHHTKSSFEYIFIPTYIELYGTNFPEISLKSFEWITPFISCEFAIRPFIIQYENYTLAKMHDWCFSNNEHLRRLASEGCRPRLPWGKALPKFKENPQPILPILEVLLNDESAYVRKSVANNLNDIGKDHPSLLTKITTKNIGNTQHTDWILKHANRNLLKQGNHATLQLFGLGSTDFIDVQNFEIKNKQINIGDFLEFSFVLISNAKKHKKIRLEYAVYYLKQNQTFTKKVFKISEKEYPNHSKTTVVRKQHFKPISTRKYYAGQHKIALIANGKVFIEQLFNLL